jgi:RNase H-like domain found in reverse transcriptase
LNGSIVPRYKYKYLGIEGYCRRFILNFSKLTKPLTLLLKKDKIFNWEESQQNAFETLRNMLTSDSILKYPDFNNPFNLTTDASNFAVGVDILANKRISCCC